MKTTTRIKIAVTIAILSSASMVQQDKIKDTESHTTNCDIKVVETEYDGVWERVMPR